MWDSGVRLLACARISLRASKSWLVTALALSMFALTASAGAGTLSPGSHRAGKP